VALAAGLAIAYLLTQPRSVYSRWLSFRGIVFVGQISYGIYLYQVLIEEVVQRGLAITDRQAIWIDVPITIMVGWLSFQYLERPLIAWGRRRAAGYVQPGG
jgi:peptidoglycan/LPS O-acetylase OafA/YrhL